MELVGNNKVATRVVLADIQKDNSTCGDHCLNLIQEIVTSNCDDLCKVGILKTSNQYGSHASVFIIGKEEEIEGTILSAVITYRDEMELWDSPIMMKVNGVQEVLVQSKIKTNKLDYGNEESEIVETSGTLHSSEYTIYTPNGNLFIRLDVYGEKLEAQIQYAMETGVAYETVRQALEQGFQIIDMEQIVNGIGQPTALNNDIHQLVRENNLDNLRIIVEQGADILQYDENLDTPLRITTRLGHIEIVEFLLEQTYNLVLTNIEHEPFNIRLGGNGIVISTILHEAVEQGGSVDMIRLLVEHGANPVRWNINADTALHLAADIENPNITITLLNGVQEEELINLPDANGFTALDRAIGQGNIETATALMEYGGNANVFATEVEEMLNAVYTQNANFNPVEATLMPDNDIVASDAIENNWCSWCPDFEVLELSLDSPSMTGKDMILLPLLISH